MNFSDRLSTAHLRLRTRHPFFATLALFAPVVCTETIATAGTDGTSLFFNEKYVASLNDDEFDGLFVHEVLHLGLLHVHRRGHREPTKWNIACDIVVNGIIRDSDLILPKGAIEDLKLCKFSAEEVYDKLPNTIKAKNLLSDILVPNEGLSHSNDSQKNKVEAEKHWEGAREQASVVIDRLIDAGKFAGTHPIHGNREWQQVREPELDWRTALWEYMIKSAVDYSGFDRRFIGRGLYLEALEGETVNISICIDTSASVSKEELSHFFSEITGILAAYPQINCELYFADADLYGPYTIADVVDGLKKPVGGGGTTFRPFFSVLKKKPLISHSYGFIAIYLTDGYAEFPSEPDFPVLWVVTKKGLSASAFPFGTVVKLRF